MKITKSSNIIIRPQRGILFYLACFSRLFVGIGSIWVLINKISKRLILIHAAFVISFSSKRIMVFTVGFWLKGGDKHLLLLTSELHK